MKGTIAVCNVKGIHRQTEFQCIVSDLIGSKKSHVTVEECVSTDLAMIAPVYC